MLFYSDLARTHTAHTIASSLYLSRSAAEALLAELIAAGIVVPAEGESFRYAPRDPALASGLQELFACYQANLVGIANLIHDSTQRSAERFASAFKLRKDR